MRFAEYRKQRGLTLEQACSELHLEAASKGFLSRIERGERSCPFELAIKIQIWSDGAVQAAELRPDLAEMISAWMASSATAAVA